MRLEIGLKTIDLDGVLRGVENLGQVCKSKPARDGLRRASRHLMLSGRSRLKSLYKGYQKGKLERSMTSRLKRRKNDALAGFRRGNGGGNHAHLVDRGTKRRYTKTGKNRGVMPANRFWTSTKLTEVGQVERLVRQGLEQAIAKIQ